MLKSLISFFTASLIMATIISCGDSNPSSHSGQPDDPNTIVLSKYRLTNPDQLPFQRQICYWDNAVSACTDYIVDASGIVSFITNDDQTYLTDINGGLLAISEMSEEMVITRQQVYQFNPFTQRNEVVTRSDTSYIDALFSIIFNTPVYELPETIAVGGQWSVNYIGAQVLHARNGDQQMGTVNISINQVITKYPGGITIGNTAFSDVILSASTRTEVRLDLNGNETSRKTSTLQSYYVPNIGLIKQDGIIGTKTVSKTIASISVNGVLTFAP